MKRPNTPLAIGTEIGGDIVFPDRWTVYAPLKATDPQWTPGCLRAIPAAITVGGRRIPARKVRPSRQQFDLRPFLGEPPRGFGQAAYVFVPLKAEADGDVTLGLGGDYRLQAWVNGVPLFPPGGVEDSAFPPSIANLKVTVRLNRGLNILTVHFISGKGSSVLALGGPRELRTGDFRSIVTDPFNYDRRWSRRALRADGGDKPVVDIGSRRELFVDDFLVDRLTGAAVRRLHHPMPREVILTLDRPWEGNYSGTFMPVVLMEEADRIRLYYKSANYEGRGDPSLVSDRTKRTRPEVTCLAESPDGIHFTRRMIGRYAFKGSKKNNIVWWGRQYFTPFKDPNPEAPASQRYKAISSHPKGGLGAYGSRDGIHWKLLGDEPIITKGAFDSQNLAFWDPLRRLYVEYHRGQLPHVAERAIMTCTSPDFIHWTDPRPLEYTDDRREHMYTNCIRPYARAPHLYIGTPARFVTYRTRIEGHSDHGVSDAILMSSRDGTRFERWEQGFIRPGTDPEVWTDRNNYPAWGMVQTSPEELSLYWCEHNGHPGVCLRRGTLRTDGFVSLSAGADVGEMLSRPLRFSGRTLEVNYATSAIGTLRFELCDETGRPFEGFALADSEVVYGNAIAHTVTWRGAIADVGALAGRPVRLRVRLHDADLYSLRVV
jgi:hypothetical protein